MKAESPLSEEQLFERLNRGLRILGRLKRLPRFLAHPEKGMVWQYWMAEVEAARQKLNAKRM